MNELWAAVIVAAVIALVLVVAIVSAPEAVTEFVRGITKFRWGLHGLEIERSVDEASKRGGTPRLIRSSLRTLPVEGRVLWVDDHPANNRAEIDLLRRRGVTVDMASNNQAAVELAQNLQYDAVISDIGRDNNVDGAQGGLDLPGQFDAVIPGGRPPVIFYSSTTRDTGIANTKSTSTPDQLFTELANIFASRTSPSR